MNKDVRGFTLIEIMVTLSIISVIMLSIGGIVNYFIYSYNNNSKYYKDKLDGRYAMNKIISEIKKNYDTSFNSGKILASDASVLINSNPNDPAGKMNYFYDANGYGFGDGYGEIRGQNGETLMRNIKNFSMEEVDEDLVKITLKTGRTNNSKQFEIITYVRLYD